ncbi:MAG: MMPL family transporter [Actinobacteria bacterium]|nr:MMPL family transporter [Actinomycetota bacterium]
MGGLSRWAVRRPWWAIGAWFVLAMVVFTLGGPLGGKLNDSFSLPDTDSLKATELLSKMPNAGQSEATASTASIVWSPSSGTAIDSASATVIVPMLEKMGTLPAVGCVTNPFYVMTDPNSVRGFGPDCRFAPIPDNIKDLPVDIREAWVAAAEATSPISPDGLVAKSMVTFSGSGDGADVPSTTAVEIINLVKAANGQSGMEVGAGGQVLSFAGQEPPSSEVIGVLVALIILLIAFGSFIAAGLPLFTAIFGVGLGAAFLLFVARFLDVATFAPTLAAMIGLGVGIDYSLFVINRFRQAIQAGRDPKQAALEAVNTSGRAVVFAASTVIIALLGLFVMRISFFNGLALAASGTVLLVMLAAVWLLPAVLSLLGRRALYPGSLVIARILEKMHLRPVAKPFRLLYRLTRHSRFVGETHAEGGRWAGYGRFLQKHRIAAALVSLGIVVALAIPALSMRLGFPDDSGTPPGSISRIAYDLTAEGFGPGANGPFFVAVQLPKTGDIAGLTEIVGALEATPGVAKVIPNTAMLPLYTESLATNQIMAIQVQPSTGPQDEATSELLNTLRTDTLPAVTATTQSEAYVGGTTAIVDDFSSVMANAMPVFLSVVVGLGFLMLFILFRSIVVSLTAVVTSLLSFAASTGITVAVFQWGWFNGPLGVTGTGPIFPFLPVMVFAILFGLAMDYQVFLVSRMQEEWARTKDNSVAVRRGLAGSGRVVLMAALIMASVFAAFIPTTDNTIKLFGVALASAVLIDAFVIRLVFVPALMSILGRTNWWLPGWLDRIIPKFDVEGGADEVTDDKTEPVGAGAR